MAVKAGPKPAAPLLSAPASDWRGRARGAAEEFDSRDILGYEGEDTKQDIRDGEHEPKPIPAREGLRRGVMFQRPGSGAALLRALRVACAMVLVAAALAAPTAITIGFLAVGSGPFFWGAFYLVVVALPVLVALVPLLAVVLLSGRQRLRS